MRQIKVPFVGTFINVLYLTMPLFGIIAYAITALTFYTVNLEWIGIHMPWMTVPVFIGLIIAFCSILMCLNYIFLYPSYYEFLNKQVYKHGNPIQEDLSAIREKLGIPRDEVKK